MESRVVLLVDDEKKLLDAFKRSLIGEPYKTLFAESGKKAIEILEQNEVHVIVTDMRMPEMSGLELLKTVMQEHPHIIRLVLSGAKETDVVLDAINQGQIFRYVTKPWKHEEFKTIIRQAIEYYDLYRERAMLMTFFEQLMDGTKPEEINFSLMKALISTRKKPLYQQSKKSSSFVDN